MRPVHEDIAAVRAMPMVPTILDVMTRMTGMRFAAVARVTDTAWTACAVRDAIDFGLQPGGELVLGTTICNEIRQHGQPVIFGSASTDERFCGHPTPKLYGIESYISIPIVRADGSFFGTLCAIDPKPAKLDDPHLLQALELFAQLIAAHLDAQDLDERRLEALAAAADTARQLDHENRRIAALLEERSQVEQVMTRELQDTRRLRDVAASLIGADGGSALYGEILDAALEIAGADAGSLQLLDPASQTLSFLATRGLDEGFLSHFACVDASSGSSCGMALTTGKTAHVVFDDPDAPDLDGAHRWHREAGMRCAQSTPLISRGGRPLGMFSTHWRERRKLGSRERRFLDLLGRQAADLIERSQVQEALRARELELREEARRKDEFIAVLAHELRNPLAPIRSGVELLKRAGSEPQLVEQVRPLMERQVGHMVRLIDDLLDVSRISSGKVQLQHETVSLRHLVDSAVEANQGAIAAAGIELRVELDDPARLLSVDPTRLAQVISNVLHNAAKFTPADGRINVRAALEAASGEGAHEQVIRISDTGVGIPAELLPSIFELFTQVRSDSSTRHGGMGIGLALARRLMALHGGAIDATSAGRGRGSEFVIRIPWLAPADARHAPPAPSADAQLAGLRVLVVDDNQDAADAISMLLSHCGAEVQVAYDAGRIVDTVKAFQPALVLLDLGLPGVDGYEACRRIRRDAGRAVLVAALTGWGQDEDRQRSQQAGFDVHLTKPVDFDRLIEVAMRAAGRAAERPLSARCET